MRIVIIELEENLRYRKIGECLSDSSNEGRCIRCMDNLHIYICARVSCEFDLALNEGNNSEENSNRIRIKNVCDVIEKLNQNGISLNKNDYIIWHPGRVNEIVEYANLLECNNGEYDPQKDPKVIFVSSGASEWGTPKKARECLYDLIEETLDGLVEIQELQKSLEEIFKLEKYELANNVELYWNCDNKIELKKAESSSTEIRPESDFGDDIKNALKRLGKKCQ